jgi:O-Antigen ligase
MTGPQGPNRPIRPTALGVLSLLVGMTTVVKLNFQGEISVAELLLPMAGLAALCARGSGSLFRNGTFWLLVVALLLTLAGYIVSDLLRDTPEAQSMRGWGRGAVLLSDIVSLGLLVAADRRNLWWFAAGFGAGGVLYLRFFENLPLPIWKHGYAEYMTVGFAAFAYFLHARVAAVGFMVLAAMSIYWDFRIHSAFCFLLAGALWYRSNSNGRVRRKIRLMPLLMVFAIVAVAVFTSVKFTESDYSNQRRASSDRGRSFGLAFGFEAIANSPLIGYGSWGQSSELLQLQRTIARRRGGELDESNLSGSTMVTHSQILQSWVEGGLLGMVFFMTLGCLLIRRARHLILIRPLDALSPILLYYFFCGCWQLVMSPYSAVSRPQIALSTALILVLALEAIRISRLARQTGRRQIQR